MKEGKIYLTDDGRIIAYFFNMSCRDLAAVVELETKKPVDCVSKTQPDSGGTTTLRSGGTTCSGTEDIKVLN